MTQPEITYLALGWGWQSFCLAAMAALGKIEGLDVAVHADTTHEMEGTYAFARKWTPWLEDHGLKVVTVKAKNLLVTYPNTGKKAGISVMPPVFSHHLEEGKDGQVKRQCTVNWKVRPLNRYVRSLLPKGNPRPGAIECWQGITLDEWQRMRTSAVKYVTNRYPLVDMRMTRGDCGTWLKEHGLEIPPKSSCTFCPYHTVGHWKRMKQDGGRDWEDAVAVDREIRNARVGEGFKLYLHPSRKPLEEGVSIPEDYGASQIGMFDMVEGGGLCESGYCMT